MMSVISGHAKNAKNHSGITLAIKIVVCVCKVSIMVYENIHVNNGNVIGFNGSDKISSLYQFQNSHPGVKNK